MEYEILSGIICGVVCAVFDATFAHSMVVLIGMGPFGVYGGIAYRFFAWWRESK